MVELTATTLNLIHEKMETYEAFDTMVASGDPGPAGNKADATSAVYVTAKMWEDCDSWEACDKAGATAIIAEPTEWIPLHVLYKAAEFSVEEATEVIHNSRSEIEATNTAKLFFPDSNLLDGTPYFLTLEFSVEVSASANACFGNTYVSMYAGATLGPHIIDAQIIKDADFGNCNWLDPDTEGCGLFDKISGDCDE
jgi:hypothetical protein